MIGYIRKLNRLDDNVFSVCRSFLREIGVKVTDTSLKERLAQHPSFPSLLSLKDVFTDFGVKNIVLKREQHDLGDFETPFICVIEQNKGESSSFTIIQTVDENRITFYHPVELSWKTISLKEFEQWDTGIVLLAEKNEFSGEKDYQKQRGKERVANFIALIPLYLCFFAVVFTLSSSYLTADFSDVWYGSSLLLFNLIGMILSFSLVWYEIDNHNPFLREICSGTKKLNCGAVLQTDGASIFGISWALVGFTYFTANFLSNILFGIDDPRFLGVWMIMSFVVAPYILYSVFYQWKVAKQWCVLCLGVQFILLLQLISAVFYLTSGHKSSLIFVGNHLFLIFMTFSITFLLANYVFSMIKKAKEGKQYQLRWQRLKSDPQIFNALLTKQPVLSIPTAGIGLVVGNPEAKHEITKVCNPYCGPCAKAHPEIEAVLHHNTEVRLRIIFTTKDDDQDMKAQVVRHLMALADSGSQDLIKRALDDWYLNPKKDYQTFAAKYPLNGELKQQAEKLNAMYKWCNDMQIRATPTIFIDGFMLPQNYRINDLKSFF